MNQTERIQRVLAIDRQAQAIAKDARQSREHMDEAIAEEIAAMEQDYQAKADAYLQSLQAQQQELSAAKLQELDHRLEEKLAQVDSLYAAKKDQWADTILERIIGKAGG